MAEATNSAMMRRKNEKIILSLINKEPISRAEIAKQTGLTKAAVTIIVDDLKKREIVIEEKVNSPSVGRNPLMLKLNGDSVYMIGINIRRTSISVGITNLCGNVIAEDILPALYPDTAFSKIKEMIEKQIKQANIEKSKIYKVSAVTPGPVDIKSGKILNPPNFKEWHDCCVIAEMKKIFDCDVIFENVASAVATAEKYFGSAKKNDSFIAIQVDEGIGSGIFIDGKLLNGSCEIGHVSIKYDGEKCECGNRGCLEKYAAVPNILKNTAYKSWQECVDCGDDILLQKEAEYLGTAIITAGNIFNVDKTVLCGDLSYKSQKLLNYITENINGNMLVNRNFDVCEGTVKSKTLIAASVAIHSFFTE